MKYGLYIHFPFCRGKCDYCGFYSIPLLKDELKAVYLKSLDRELDMRLSSMKDAEFDTIYFGGGTPSLFSPEEFYTLMKSISRRANLSHDTEVSMEMNPGDARTDRIKGYRDSGINRIILGVQTLTARLHDVLGRYSSVCTTSHLDEFFSVPDVVHCVDLIIGIPGETPGELEHDIRALSSYRPGHISAYILSIEQGTPLEHRYEKNDSLDEFQRERYYQAIHLLEKSGYVQYEISNFSLPGLESRHNMKYWTFMPYLGIGAGAHSFINGERYCNNPSVDEYMHSSELHITIDKRTRESAVMEYMMTGLRLVKGIDISSFEERFGMKLNKETLSYFADLDGRGLLMYNKNIDGGNIRLSRESYIIADSIIFGIINVMGGNF